jgi:hypothetical protein
VWLLRAADHGAPVRRNAPGPAGAQVRRANSTSGDHRTVSAAHQRRGTAISSLIMNLRIRTIEDFFKAPDIDPLSDWFDVYSLTSGIEFVVDEIGDEPRVSHVDVIIRMPPEAIADGLEGRVRAGIDKYCNARLRVVEQAAREDRSRGWLMMAFSVVAVFVLIWSAQKLAGTGESLLGVAAEGLSIAAWVLLWHPLQELVFDRWTHRLDRRALRTLRDRSSVRVEAIPRRADPTT